MNDRRAARAPAAPQAPVRGATHRLLGRFHVTGVFWYRLHAFGARHVPAWMHGFFITLFTAAFTPFLGRIRNAVNANLEPVLGPAGGWTRWRRAYRTFHALAHCLSDRYRRGGGLKISVEGQSNWDAGVRPGSGAVLVTGHIGPWELLASGGAEHERRKVHVVREEEMDPEAQAFIRELMAEAGDQLVTHFYTHDDPRLAIELAEALKRGELVALQADRPRAGSRVVHGQIFGKPFAFPAGPAALARAVGVPLVPVFMFREGTWSGRMVVRAPITVARTADRDADLDVAVRSLAREIEWAIRERPHQWFCFRNLWP